MDPKLTFRYDRVGDILYVETRAPYPEQDSEELGDEVVARLSTAPQKSLTGCSGEALTPDPSPCARERGARALCLPSPAHRERGRG